MIVFLSLGTNLGDKEKNLQNAINEIEKRIGTIKAQSAFLVTEPWGFKSENTFLNAAVKVETSLMPMDILDVTQDIEKCLGRTRKSQDGKYHDRVIDIDILMCFESNAGDDYCEEASIHYQTSRLIIPHPLMKERDFVLIPLNEIR